MQNAYKTKIFLHLAAAFSLFLPASAFAEVSVVLNNPGTVQPGTVVSVTGTITNNATSTTVFINSAAGLSAIPSNQLASSSAAFVSVDQAASVSYLPLALNAGQSYQNSLMKINLSSQAYAGDYLATYNVLGGENSSSTDALATQYFVLHVGGNNFPAASSTTASTTDYSGFVGLQMQDDTSRPENEMGDKPLPIGGPWLVKTSNSATVYWISPESGLKLGMFSAKVFLSYNNKWEEVVTVSQQELDAYPDAKYIWLNGSGVIYKIEKDIRRPIPSSIWNPSGMGPDRVVSVNGTELNSYKLGAELETAAELEN